MKGKCARLSVIPLLVLLLFFFGAFAAFGEENRSPGVDPVGRPDGYSAVLYDNTNGLPTSEANTIVEARDGFLWIGSYGGLIRYDGNTFERMDSVTGVGGAVSLYVDAKDRLWIGTNDAGVAVLEKGVYRRWGVRDGLPAARVCDITDDNEGNIYVGTTAGIAVIDPEGNLRHLDEDERIRNIYVEMICRDKDGLVYGISSTNDLFTLRDGELSEFYSRKDLHAGEVSRIVADPDNPGYVWIGTQASKVYYGALGDGFEKKKEIDISPMASVMDLKKAGGRLWISARNGIGVLDKDGFHYLEDLPMDNSVGHILEDYEGNMWFSSTRQGVMKIVPNRFTSLFERYGLPEDVVNSTCFQGGRLFVGTDSGLLVLGEEEAVSRIPLIKAETASGKDLEAGDLLELLEGKRIRSVIRDSRGNLWISTWGTLGLIRYAHGEAVVFTEEDGLFSNYVRAVCEREDGAVLAVQSGGVTAIRDDRVVERYGKEEGILNSELLTVSDAPNGDILLGSNGDGIYVVRDGKVSRIGLESGLSSEIIMRIRYDEKRNIFWLVTSNSLAYMTDDYQVTTIKNFPYSNNFDLYENNSEVMWVLSSNGIYVVPTAELLANGDINPVHYSIANGLPCTPTSNSYSELTKDGELYLAGGTGVVKVNIDEPVEAVEGLKVSVPYVDADGVRIYPDEDGGFRLPSKVYKLTIYSYVFNYSLTDPKVVWQLEGFDRFETETNRSGLDSITYTNLPGGNYTFVMRLEDSQRMEDRTFTIPIIKEKAFYEEPFFAPSVIALVLLLLVGGTYLYIREKTRKMELKNREAMKQEILNNELKMANQIQEGVLPHIFPPFPDRTEFDIYASMTPARQVGGDFYDFYLVDDDHLCLVIADVSGKGIPAALYMMISKIIVQSSATLGQSAADILVKTNEMLMRGGNQLDMFVTVWVGILEISTGIITAANAGHEYPAVEKDGVFTLYKDPHGFVIGGMEGMKYKEYTLKLEPGDKIFVYTDGVPEAENAARTMFGTERMLEALNSEPSASPEKTLANVHAAVDSFVKNAEQFDDLTMLCLEYKGGRG